MKFSVKEAETILGRTPDILQAWLPGLPDEWVMSNEGGETWSAFDIVGHLIHGERTDWIPRAQHILSHGQERAFEPFDRFAQSELNQGKQLDELLEEFAHLRRTNLQQLNKLNLTADHLARRGKHPEFGTVTLAQLLATWVVHDLNHLAQIARALAKQYDTEVGPWRKYLPILGK
jgi:uncharacterized damage-inducible protein DinB